MDAFTGRNKDYYFQFSTVQTNVSQPGFHRTCLGISTEIVELINTELEIPQKIPNICLSKSCEQVDQRFGQEFNICAERIMPKCHTACNPYIDLRYEIHLDV
jgi:hypothetical protein